MWVVHFDHLGFLRSSRFSPDIPNIFEPSELNQTDTKVKTHKSYTEGVANKGSLTYPIPNPSMVYLSISTFG